MRRRLLLAGLVVMLAASCNPCKQLSATEVCDRRESTVSVGRVGPYDVLPVTVQGRVGSVIVDTGSSITVFSSAWQGVPDHSAGLDVRVLFGGMRIQAMRVSFIDSPFSSAKVGEINGLIGTNILYGLSYRSDPGRSATLSVAHLGCGGRVVRLRGIGANRPYLDDVTIAGLRLRNVMLDTGAAGVLLSAETVTLLAAELAGAEEVGHCSFDGCVDSGAFTTTVPEVCVAGICEAEVTVKWPAWDAIGLAWLNRHSYIVSLDRMELEICP
jgi:hypothetical protein